MTRYLLYFAMIVLFIAKAYSQPDDSGPKGLAIMEFQVTGDVHRDAGPIVANLITNHINLKQYYVVERTQLPEVVREQWYNMGDTIDVETAGKTKSYKISYVMLGHISKIEGKYYGGYRIVHVDTVRKTEAGTVEAACDLDDFSNKIIELLVKNFMPPRQADLLSVPLYPISAPQNYIYLLSNGNFYAGKLDELLKRQGISLDSGRLDGLTDIPLKLLDTGGWTGEMEIANGHYYFLKEGNFYGGTLNGFNRQPMKLLDRGGWYGEFEAADNGYYYFLKEGNLYGGTINGLNRGPLQLIDQGGWFGHIEVEAGYLYFAKGQYLYAVEIDGVEKKPENILKVIGHHDWQGDFEIANAYLYFVKQNRLYITPVHGLILGDSRILNTALEVWNGKIVIPK